MKILELNHVALPVRDLDISQDFYENALGLEKLERPAFAFPGAWYRLGTTQELHLIARDNDFDLPVMDRHFALRVENITEAATALREAGVEFRGPKPRPDGAMQIFLRDPDGHVIELCSAPG